MNYWKAIGISVDLVILERPAWMAARDGGKMKEAIIVDQATATTIGGQLSYLLGSGAYGSYPDIQALWDKYQQNFEPNARKDLITRIQKLIHEKMMWIPVTGITSPLAAAKRVKGNPCKIPLVWFASPFEDIELEK
jgi:ABC-type transport system substrate-binding protein